MKPEIESIVPQANCGSCGHPRSQGGKERKQVLDLRKRVIDFLEGHTIYHVWEDATGLNPNLSPLLSSLIFRLYLLLVNQSTSWQLESSINEVKCQPPHTEWVMHGKLRL